MDELRNNGVINAIGLGVNEKNQICLDALEIDIGMFFYLQAVILYWSKRL